MKLVYIIGPYRAETEWEVVQNIRRAEALALEVWKLGAVAICPHKNTALFGGALPDEIWLAGGLDILKRCDAVICVEGWEKSKGSQQEVSFAEHDLDIPIFTNLVFLSMWLRDSNYMKISQLQSNLQNKSIYVSSPLVRCLECQEVLKSHAGRGGKYFHEWAHGPYDGSSSGKCRLDGMAFEIDGTPIVGSDKDRKALVVAMHGNKGE